MTRPTGPDDPKWGGTSELGVLITSAPAWDGDLGALTDEELAERAVSLGRHIGALHTRWDFKFDLGAPTVVWRPATVAELEAGELSRWVAARVAVLQEEEDRSRAANRSAS